MTTPAPRAVRLALAAALAGIAALLAGVVNAAPAAAGPGLGGSTSFTEHSVLNMFPGKTLPPTQYLYVENVGDAGSADVEFDWSAPDGVTVNPVTTTTRLAQNEGKRFFFGVSVAESTAAGSYEVKVGVKQSNVKKQGDGQIILAPRFGGTLEIAVQGASADVTVKAVSENDGTPVTGNLRLSFLPPEGVPIAVLEGNGVSEISSRVAPGNYQALFEIPGLIQKTEDFTLADGENRVVELKLDAVNFIVNGVNEKYDGKTLITADLVASVRNNLREIPGPVTIDVKVTRDGTEIDSVRIQSQPLLPPGITEGRGTYRPIDGWAPGLYKFTFVLNTPTFSITAPNVPEIAVGGGIVSLLLTALIIVFVGGLIALSIRFLIARRRPKVEVPDLVGLGVRAAYRALSNVDLKMGEETDLPSDEPPGVVLAQVPRPGAMAHKGDPVHLTISASRGVASNGASTAQQLPPE